MIIIVFPTINTFVLWFHNSFLIGAKHFSRNNYKSLHDSSHFSLLAFEIALNFNLSDYIFAIIRLQANFGQLTSFFILERIRNISLIFAWKSLFPSSRYLFDFSADFRPIRDLTSKSATKGLETNQKTFQLLKRKLIYLELGLTINQKLVQYK